MTALNRVIAEAKRGAKELRIRSNEVRGIAEHFRLTARYGNPSIDTVERMMRAGDMYILGVPVRVIEQEGREPS